MQKLIWGIWSVFEAQCHLAVRGFSVIKAKFALKCHVTASFMQLVVNDFLKLCVV